MGLRFETPIWLLLLVPALLLTFLPHLAARRRMGARRRRAALAIRTILLSALVFALAGFQLVLPVDRLATVFVVDLSDSVGNDGREDALAFLRESLEAMPDGDQAGIVAFGKDALVERLPEEIREIDRLRSAPLKAATDVGAALRLAAALFPDAAQKRIVLLSDGNDTTGRGQREAALAAARGIQVETRTIGLIDSDEVLVERLRTPSTARLGEAIPVDAIVSSSVAQPATIRLYLNGTLIRTERRDLKPGSNTVSFGDSSPSDDPPILPTEAGFYRFRVVVEAARNTFSQNDRADSNTIVKGEPRTLVLQGDAKVAAELVAALEQEGQQVDSMVPEALPTDLASLLNYDSIVVVDVPRLRFNDAQLAALQTFVRDIGRGVVMVGGPRAYGAGGYTKTKMEELLPVEMGVRNRQREPDIALVVVIDKSGSMDACHCNTFDGGMGGGGQLQGVKKTDIGKEAILRAAAALSARDEFGVVAFDQQAHWVINTKPLGETGDVGGQLGSIVPNGQTNIFSGLDQAVGSLENAEATRRHIILLTDGWSTSGQYDAIIERMKAAGITLSTVGAGGGSNPFLEQLAKNGGGRFYAAANIQSIPDIFLKETQQVAGQQIVEEAFFPIVTSSSPITRGLEDGYPQLLGYNGTTIKSAAQLVLVSPRDDPLLAQWQYGLGRSVAWTSDSTGRWAKNWLAWPGFSRFFTQLVSWTFPGDETDGIEASFESLNGQTRLHVQSVEADGSPRDFYNTLASITGPDFNTAQISLDQIAPGVYEANLGEIDSGAYAVRITQSRAGAAALGRTVGLVEPVAAEYRLLGVNLPLLAALRGATGGIEVTLPTDPWIHDLKTTSSFTELWPWLLVLALLLWPLDVALRRVSLGRRELADARAWVGRAVRGRRSAAPRTAASEGMLAARERAGGGAARAALLRGTSEAAGASPAGGVTGVPAAGAAGSGRSATHGSGPVASAAAPATSPPPASPAPASRSEPNPEETDTLARLREAKRRARGG
jgi:uncharacterized membrane protein/Mg-chelatase subunit ChlD